MKFFLAAAAIACLASVTAPAQTVPAATTANEPQHQGKVLFSRSTDENGQTTTQTATTSARPAIQNVAAPVVEDADREAITFTSLDLDVHLRVADHAIAVRSLLTVRNDGKVPLARIPLQISSTLQWERIRILDKDATFTVATLNSDSDHTGQLHEAAVTLAQPLAPGATIEIDGFYSGTIEASAQRLLAVGAPQDAALHSDWDAIGTDFTGLRGFGNVVWYPVASAPVILGDGARLFDEIGEQKLRLRSAHFRLRLAVEFPPNRPPTVALVNGRPVQLSVTNPPSDVEVSGVATAKMERTALGDDPPSLFVAIRSEHAGPGFTAWANPEQEAAIQDWSTAASTVEPLLESWLGKQPHSQLTLLDLPDQDDAPFESGALLATPLRVAQPWRLSNTLAHSLTHAWLAPTAPAWLNEGAATFLGTLWIEKQLGRKQALETLEASRGALALVEPESPGQSSGQPLDAAIAPIYYRTKAAYVLWMLRDMAGDAALSAGLRAVNSTSGSGFEKSIEQAGNRDLGWFFADWVDADKGLPDLSIESAFPDQIAPGTWLVAVNVANNGYAAVEVPLIVRSDATTTTQRIQIPARGKVTQRIQIQGKPLEVQLNDGAVPETQASVHITRLDQATPGSSSGQAPSQ